MRKTSFRPACRAALLVLLATLTGIAAARADEADKKDAAASKKISFYRDIRPIFQAHCQGCHQPAKQSGEYVMTNFKLLLEGGESEEAAIVPGKPANSYLMDQIAVIGGKAEMPKDKKPLSEDQTKLIEKWIAEGAADDTPASARPKYDMDNPPRYNLAPVLTSLDFSPDGKLLAVSGYHEVLLHDVSQMDASDDAPLGRLVGLSERIEAAVFSPDGKLLAVTGGSPGRMGEVQIWDVAARKLLLSVPVTYDTLYGASWSPDGKVISFGCADKTLRAIDRETGKQVLFSGAHDDWVLDTVFSVKGTHVISVSRDRSMKLVELATERFVDNITSITPGALKGGLSAVDRHPTKDELLIGGADGVVKIYKMFRTQARKIGDDYNKIRAFPALPGRVFDVAYSRDGNQVVAGSSDTGKGEVHVFNANDGKLIAKMEGQQGAVYCVAFSPDGKLVASGGFDGQVRINDAASGKLLRRFFPVQVERRDVAAADGE